MNFFKRAKNAILRSPPKSELPSMQAAPKPFPNVIPTFSIPVTVVIIWNGQIKKGMADNDIADERDVDAGFADHIRRDSAPPAFNVKFPDGGTTVVITDQEGLTWARGHSADDEAALAAAFALWENAPVMGFQGATGAQGPTGPQGATGVQGAPGVRGFGPMGIQGATGVQGRTSVGVQGSSAPLATAASVSAPASSAPSVIVMGTGRAPP